MGRKDRLRFCSCCRTTIPQAIYEEHAHSRNLTRLEADVASLTLVHPQVSHEVVLPSNATTQQTVARHPVPDPMVMFRELQRIDSEATRLHAEHLEIVQAWCSTTRSSSPTRDTTNSFPQSRTEALEKLQRGRMWLKEYHQCIKTSVTGQDKANQLYVSGLLHQLQQYVEESNQAIAMMIPEPNGNGLAQTTPRYDTSRYFSNPLQSLEPASLLVLFISIVLSIVANITRGPCNFVLRMARLALQVATDRDSRAFCDIPNDIRTARKAFQLDPVLKIFATCDCSKLHPPTTCEPFPIYPATCECDRKLTKVGHFNGVAIRKPRRPYAMQDFTDFRARLYTRPGIEELIRRQHTYTSEGECVDDITEANAYQNLRGPDGKRFVDCPTEIRTIWVVSYDGYNPLTNKISGKSTSVGSLAMACLSLPPCLRYRPENLYLVGLIPGPKQPAADGLNPYLSPLVDVLHSAYHEGTFFERTYEHPEGVVSREALLPSINDLPAARKLVGAASHSATIFCMLCHVTLPDINNIDMNAHQWRGKTTEQFRKAAEEWRDATSKSKKKKLYERNGVRWSELLRLEYWDPLQNVVIDGMHNLFLGLVQHHFREVIGMKWDEAQAQYDETRDKTKPSDHLMQAGRKILHQCLPELVKGSMLVNAGASNTATESKAQPLVLDEDIVSSFTSANLRGIAVETFSRIHRHDSDFTPHSVSRAHSVVFFKQSRLSEYQPGSIRQIFKHDGILHLVVHRYRRKETSYFDHFPDFGAGVWSKDLETQPETIPLTSSVYSGNLCEWDGSSVVMRPYMKDF